MKRKQGRPPGPAKFLDDIALVKFVKLAADRGVKVKPACAEYRGIHGAKVGTTAQLVKRYERIASAYPGKIWVDSPGPGEPILRRIFGKPQKAFGPKSLAATLLTWPTRKPSK